jgi:hypothetical protein
VRVQTHVQELSAARDVWRCVTLLVAAALLILFLSLCDFTS